MSKSLGLFQWCSQMTIQFGIQKPKSLIDKSIQNTLKTSSFIKLGIQNYVMKNLNHIKSLEFNLYHFNMHPIIYKK